MAQGYSMSGDLYRAIDYGFCNQYFLEHEPYIENLRNDGWFDPLMEKVKGLSESLLD